MKLSLVFLFFLLNCVYSVPSDLDDESNFDSDVESKNVKTKRTQTIFDLIFKGSKLFKRDTPCVMHEVMSHRKESSILGRK